MAHNSYAYAPQTLTVTAAAAVSLTPPAGETCRYAVFYVGDNTIRFTVNGTTPTATLGQRAIAGERPELFGEDDVHKFQAIGESATATLEIEYRTWGPNQ